MTAAGDELAQLARDSGNLTPSGTLMVMVSVSRSSANSSDWAQLAVEAAAQFECHDDDDVTAVGFWRTEQACLGFVTRDAFDEKVRPKLLDAGDTRAPNDTTFPISYPVNAIGPIKRTCTYTEARLLRRVQCGFERAFMSRPDDLPTCDRTHAQRKGLIEHRFEW